MTDRIHNFSAGPAVLPEPVLRKAQEAIWNVAGSGIGIMEHSHRGKVFDKILDEAEADCRALAGIPDDYAVLFLQGGASLQFSMVPMNFLPADRTADYLNTGVWSQKAIKEAKILGGKVHIAASSEATNFDRIPQAGRDHVLAQPGLRPPHDQQHDLRHPVAERARGSRRRAARGRHVERHVQPADRRPEVRPDLRRRPEEPGPVGHGAGHHPEGPGRRPAPRRCRPCCSTARSSAENSLYNTPPTIGIYLVGEVFKWIQAQGGLAGMAEHNAAKAKLLYDYIDASDFFRGTVQPDSRSLMNVCFRAPTEELEAKFIGEATKRGLDGLKGHR